MENKDLYVEFEEYVKRMAGQMTREIYMEDLKKIYISYQECLKGMQEHSGKLAECANQMKEQRIVANADLSTLKTNMEESANRVEVAMDLFYQEYRKLLGQYEEKIVFLNARERENYNKQIQEILSESYKKEKRDLETIFGNWKKDLEFLSGNMVTEEGLLQLKDQLAQVGEIVKNTSDERYLETMTDFSHKLKEQSLWEQKELEKKVKMVFHEESEKTRQMLQEYQKSLKEAGEQLLTRNEMQDFQRKLTEYTEEISGIAKRRYEEVLKAFEEKLFQMGSWQFHNYIKALSESSVKISDLELFLGQVKLLEESMKQGLKNSYEEYKTIFNGYRAKVQEVNKEAREKLTEELTVVFHKQYEKMKEKLEQHMTAMEQLRNEQKELLQCVRLIQKLTEENHSRLKLLSRVVSDVEKQQEFMMEKINLATDAMEDNSKQVRDILKLVKEESQQLQESFGQLKAQKEELRQINDQSQESIRQVQEITQQVNRQMLEVNQTMQEVSRKSEEQKGVLNALITETAGWKIDLFGRCEVNLIYVILFLLVGIFIKLFTL